MSDERELLRRTAEIAADFVDGLDKRPVFPRATVEELAAALGGPLPDGPTDPLEVVEEMAEVVQIVRETDAWLHIDGAFGLWVAASPTRRHLVDGAARADSWATDAHKWLNVPYDCGLVFCARPAAHNASMTMHASYFEGQGKWLRDAVDWTPESSRRARAFTVYAALRSLGRQGVADLVDGCCARAGVRRSDRRAPRVHRSERRRDQPGALPLRR